MCADVAHYPYHDEVDVSATKSLVPSTRRKRRRGPIFIDEDWGLFEPGFDESGSDESGSDDDRTPTMLMPGDEDDSIALLRVLRADLKLHEMIFKTQYSYGAAYGSSDSPGSILMDVRHCITSHTRNPFALPEESSGITWVGVHTGNDICVATLWEHVDRKRLQRCLPNLTTRAVLSIFRKCVLSELEDLADPTSKLCEKLHRSIDDFPFCVVSTPTRVTAETFDESGHETSSDAYDVPDAVAFVRESGLLEQAKDSGGAIKLAISAFRRLMACEAKEIEVTVASGIRNGRVTIRELGFPEIIEYAQEYSASNRESM